MTEESTITATLHEHQCSNCDGRGHFWFQGSDLSCDCSKGFNQGFRWSSSVRNNEESEDDNLGKSIASNTSKKRALDGIYDHAFAHGAKAIVLTTTWYGGTYKIRTIRPRFLPQRIQAAQREEVARNAREQKEHFRALHLDPIVALWSLNRHAKRIRDRKASGDKNEIYQLKGQALHHLLAEGKLRGAGYHRIGSLPVEVLSDGTHSFHRPCPEPEGVDIEYIGYRIESKAIDNTELDYETALIVVRLYLESKLKVKVYEWPDTRMCYECGKVGHVAEYCTGG
jgi:hypothetical protein